MMILEAEYYGSKTMSFRANSSNGVLTFRPSFSLKSGLNCECRADVFLNSYLDHSFWRHFCNKVIILANVYYLILVFLLFCRFYYLQNIEKIRLMNNVII